MKKIQQMTFLLVILFLWMPCFSQEISKLEVVDLPNLPAETSTSTSIGYAGMLGGVHNGVLLAAGGANFPEGLPWEGGKKVWTDAIFIYDNGQWRLSASKLPMPLGYSASVATAQGILCIGGNNENLISDHVFLLGYNNASKEVEIIEYPKLPEPLAFSSAVVVDDFVYVVGGTNAKGSTNSFYRLSLKGQQQWEKLTDFPGPARALHTTAVQETQTTKKLFVIGGRNERVGQKSEALTSYLSYDFKNQVWADEGDVLIKDAPRVLMGASAEVMGSMHIMVY
ncbi:kelch repeat-containing protein, partial [Gelidibacter sp.]|uniref:kelch repeat-containing protein n=1 Tax=Gelidibacter sp. TaxID=2018083 RepID=UPI002C90203E